MKEGKSRRKGRAAPEKLSLSFRGALRTFAFWLANGTAGKGVLDGVDCRALFTREPSALEGVFAVFGNVIEMDEDGRVLNAKYAERRAAQYVRQYMTGEAADPPFEDWEIARHEPPPATDPGT
jgi:hypothetical protein